MALTLKQRKERTKYIGGSDCAAIFGLSKWATPLDVYLSKTQDPEELEEEVTTELQEYGNLSEPLVIESFQKRTGKTCLIDKDTHFHPQYPFIAANIDARLIDENAILEAKTANKWMIQQWGESGSDDIPTEYLFQNAHYSAVLELDRVYTDVAIGAIDITKYAKMLPFVNIPECREMMLELFFSVDDVRSYEYVKNTKLEKMIIEKEVAFWNNHVIPRIPPAATNTADALKLWQLAAPGTLKTTNNDINQIISEMKEIKRQIKAFDNVLQDKLKTLIDFMQDTETLVDENGNQLLTWKNQTSNRFDVTKFKTEYPHMHVQYIKPSTSRVLRLKGE